MVILVTGGSRSGKSSFALGLASRMDAPRLFLATAQAFDEEMRRRIESHRTARPSGWVLIEEPVAVPAALRAARLSARTIIVDCVTVWMANLLIADESFGEQDAAANARALLESARGGGPGSAGVSQGAGSAIAASDGNVIIVTNEVGSGIVPDNALARRFRDCAGRANQVLAAGADEVSLIVSGIPVTLKSAQGVTR